MTPFNSELFEFNKMLAVYLLTILIGAVWAVRMIKEAIKTKKELEKAGGSLHGKE